MESLCLAFSPLNILYFLIRGTGNVEISMTQLHSYHIIYSFNTVDIRNLYKKD